ncbi:hypothetical protein NL108_018407 [Boleophthalmus pectinirostris]|nr:hypothetical protein NL108_018407 [Boleophthalmus pectinirostris]
MISLNKRKQVKRLDDEKTMFENKLLQKSKELAHQLKDKAKDEDELQKHFNRVWEGWVSELTQGTKPIENVIITNDVYNVLQQLGFESTLIHKSETSKAYKDLPRCGDYSPYERHKKTKQETEKPISTKLWNLGKKVVTTIQHFTGFLPQEQNQIRALILAVEKEALDVMKKNPVATRGYSSTYLCEMATYVITRVADFESHWKCSLTKEFTVDLILYVFHRTEEWISKSHDQYIKNNDARTYLESKRNEYYTVFRSFCRGSSSAVVLAEVICEKLKSSMTEAVCNRTAIDIAGHMRENDPAFNENRLNLEKHVLKALAEEEDFKHYINYIHTPQRHTETFIQKKVHEYMKEEKNVRLLIKKNVEDIEKFVTEALHQATEKGQEGNVTIWLQEFDNVIKEKLTAVSISSENFSDVNKFDFLKDAIQKGLVPIIQDLEKLSLKEINKARMQPDQMLIDQFCNCCWEKCPFCSAVCTNTVKDHSPDKHCVPYHRPSGIKGWHFRGTRELSLTFVQHQLPVINHFILILLIGLFPTNNTRQQEGNMLNGKSPLMDPSWPTGNGLFVVFKKN